MRTFRWMIASAVAVALAGCGADEISSAGAGGYVDDQQSAASAEPDPDPTPDPDADPPRGRLPDFVYILTANPVRRGTITRPIGHAIASATCRACFNASTDSASRSRPAYALHGSQSRRRHRLEPRPRIQRRGVGGSDHSAGCRDLRAKTGTSWLAVNRGNQHPSCRHSGSGRSCSPAVTTSWACATDDFARPVGWRGADGPRTDHVTAYRWRLAPAPARADRRDRRLRGCGALRRRNRLPTTAAR